MKPATDISRVSVTVAVVLGGAYVAGTHTITEGLIFLVVGFILLFLFWLAERIWIEYCHNRGIGRR